MQIKHKLMLFMTLCAIQLFALERPNVIVILTDDQGWGDLSIHGNVAIDTPNIDRLAREGAQFDRFYVSPVCSPTRAELLTGRHHVRCGVYDMSVVNFAIFGTVGMAWWRVLGLW